MMVSRGDVRVGKNVADISNLMPMLANHSIRYLHAATIIFILKRGVREIGKESVCMPWAKGNKQSNNAGLRNDSQPLTLLNYSTSRLGTLDNWSLSTWIVQHGENQLGR